MAVSVADQILVIINVVVLLYLLLSLRKLSKKEKKEGLTTSERKKMDRLYWGVLVIVVFNVVVTKII